MAMHLRRNLGKYFTPVGPFSAGFAGSSTARSGASARATALLPARRQFSSWSATHLKREFHELMAEFKELSFSDCLQLTIGTCVFACAVQRTLCDIKEFTKSACSRTGIANLKFSDKRFVLFICVVTHCGFLYFVWGMAAAPIVAVAGMVFELVKNDN